MNKVPEDWDTIVIVTCFKNNGDEIEWGNYKGLKLLEHTIKVFDRVIKQKIWEVVDIDAIQFGFMPGKGTIDIIFIAHQLQEGYLEKKKLFFASVGLAKECDWVPREWLSGLWWIVSMNG